MQLRSLPYTEGSATTTSLLANCSAYLHQLRLFVSKGRLSCEKQVTPLKKTFCSFRKEFSCIMPLTTQAVGMVHSRASQWQGLRLQYFTCHELQLFFPQMLFSTNMYFVSPSGTFQHNRTIHYIKFPTQKNRHCYHLYDRVQKSFSQSVALLKR
jgi:hypothetical protein